MQEIVGLSLPCPIIKQLCSADRYDMPADLLLFFIRAPPPAI